MTDTEFARLLVEKIGVAAVPGSSFYHHWVLSALPVLI